MSEVKRGESLAELSSWVCNHPAREAILFSIDAPKLLSHIYAHGNKITGLNKLVFRHHVQKLVNLKIIKCLTPTLKAKEPGKVYGLTGKGLKLKKIICDKENKDCVYRRLNGIDWDKYGKVILGPQRVALLKALDNEHPQRIYELVDRIKEKLNYKTHTQKIRNRPQDKAWGMIRQNVNNTLRWLIRQGLVVDEKFPGRKRRHKPITKYRLTREGELIKRQMLESFKLY